MPLICCLMSYSLRRPRATSYCWARLSPRPKPAAAPRARRLAHWTGSKSSHGACGCITRSQDRRHHQVTCGPQHVAGGRGWSANTRAASMLACRASCNVGGLRILPSPPPHWRQHLQCPDRPHAPSPRSSDRNCVGRETGRGQKPAGPVVPPRIGRGRRTFQSEFRALRTAAALGWSGLACSQS